MAPGERERIEQLQQGMTVGIILRDRLFLKRVSPTNVIAAYVLHKLRGLLFYHGFTTFKL